jgi:O-antigen/teichoic acid export membrane protein
MSAASVADSHAVCKQVNSIATTELSQFGTAASGVESWRARISRWVQVSLYSGAAQAMVQACGLLAGIVIVRDLSPRQYAFYTIVTAGLGALTVLTDGGVCTSLLAQGGAVWQDRARLGVVIATGLRMRLRLVPLALCALPFMVGLLRHQGASWTEATLIPAAVVPLFLATISGHVLETVPRLHQALAPLQRIQVAANSLRLALVALLLPALPLAAAASLIAALPQWWANWRLRRLADHYADWRTTYDREVAAKIASQVRRMMPAAIYYAFSGQLTIWVVSAFGSARSVASVGALGRVTMVLSILTIVFGTIAVPRFARIPSDDRSRVRWRYVEMQAFLLTACLVLLLALSVFAGPALAILGPNYSGLRHEIVLMGLNGLVSVCGGAAYSLGAVRGVVAPAWLVVPYSAATQILLIILLPVDTVGGVIWVGTFSSLSQWLLHAAYFTWHWLRERTR